MLLRQSSLAILLFSISWATTTSLHGEASQLNGNAKIADEATTMTSILGQPASIQGTPIGNKNENKEEVSTPVTILKEQSSAAVIPELNSELNLVNVNDETEEVLKKKKILDEDIHNYEDLEHWVAPEELQKNYPYYYSGHDPEGRPIWVMEFGRLNLRTLVKGGQEMMGAFEKYTDQIIFRLLSSLKAAGVTEAVFIIDFDGLELWHVAYPPSISFGLRLLQKNRGLVQKYLGPTIVLNTNYLAENLMNMVKPLMGAAFQKVEVFGTNKDRWTPTMRRLLGASQIPSWYGGSQKDFKPVAVYGR